MKSRFDVLVNTDAFVAMFLPRDVLSPLVTRLIEQFEKRQKTLCTTNWIVAETATALSYADSHQTALNFITMIGEGSVPVLPVTTEIEQEAYRIFCDRNSHSPSMVDCSTVAIAQHYSIKNIFAFNEFYDEFDLDMPMNRNARDRYFERVEKVREHWFDLSSEEIQSLVDEVITGDRRVPQASK